MIGVSTIVVGELMKSGEASLQTGPFGTQLKASDYVEEGVPVINVRNIGHGRLRDEKLEYLDERMADKLDAHRLKRGDIVFGRKGAVDRHLLVDETTEGWIQGSDCLRLRIESRRVFPPFVSFYFDTKGHKDWMDALCSFGATMTSLNQDIVSRITLPFPSYEAQKKIAGILSAYDELMENNRRRIALLEKLAEEIYREWFVRLRFPSREKVKLVKGRPETWTEKKFGDFCVLQRGHDLPDADVVPGPYPIIASTSIKGYHHEFKALPPVVTTGRSGSLGEVLMVHTKAWPLNTALYVKDFCGNSAFLVYYTLKNMGLEKFNAGAGVPSLNRNHLTGIKINVPDAPLQTRFDELVGPIHEQKEQHVKMNEALRQTRDLLLPRLISGKLSVEDLDIQFPPGMAVEKPAGS
jgi:type I restriction enzyme S subunit